MSLLSADDLKVHLPTARGVVHAVNGVSLAIEPGETVGLIGESGCGKSTLGKTLSRLIPSSSGSITLDGEDITHLERGALAPVRRKVQMIFQDNFSALNPRHTVAKSIGQPLRLARWQRPDADERVRTLLAQVGLPQDIAERYPAELSGGQRQRVGIARAIALDPKLVICDEPISALDVSIRAQVINLLRDLQARRGISYLFISHDLTAVEHIADRVMVMYLGYIVEQGSRETFWDAAEHPYTHALMAAIPAPDPRSRKARDKSLLQGDLPSNLHLSPGCPFQTRCPLVTTRCRHERPLLHRGPGGNDVACHLVPEAGASAGKTDAPRQNWG